MRPAISLCRFAVDKSGSSQVANDEAVSVRLICDYFGTLAAKRHSPPNASYYPVQNDELAAEESNASEGLPLMALIVLDAKRCLPCRLFSEVVLTSLVEILH